MAITVDDRLQITESISRYFAALESSRPQDLRDIFEPDAIWEVIEYKGRDPIFRVQSFEEAEQIMRGNAAGPKHLFVHHLYNPPIFDELTSGEIRSTTRVLAFDQNWPWDIAPRPRNFAFVTALWIRREGRWRIKSWSIQRGPSRSTPLEAEFAD
jgi:hypothetical protein